MKVATLTLPFHPNYGAVLQAFALQKALKTLGYDTKAIDIDRKLTKKFHRAVLSDIKAIIQGREVQKGYGNESFAKFIEKEISRTKRLNTPLGLYSSEIQAFDAYIVGSDQVWRPGFVPLITRYFFDFVKNDKAKLISYAASFGVSEWEYDESLQSKCRKLVSKFHAVSVREQTAVGMCSENFGVNAIHVLDPTLIVDRKVYDDAIASYAVDKDYSDTQSCYILDRSSTLLQAIKKNCNKAVVMNEGLKECEKIGPGCWLKMIRDSEFVITDSFHGVVFCIIFQKNFIAIGNTNRGLARFRSLLTMFNLEDRLIIDSEFTNENFVKLLNKKVNYCGHDEKLNKLRSDSINFIKSSIG